MDAEYNFVLKRTGNDFTFTKFEAPDDNVGKVILSFMLVNIAEHLNPNLTVSQNALPADATGGDGA